MNNITVRVHCKNNDEWYDIDSSTDVEELIEQISNEIDDDRTSDLDLVFDQWELPELLKFYKAESIAEDLPQAIEALEDADHDLEVYEAYEDNMSTSPSDARDIENLIKDADEAYQGEYRDDEAFARQLADDIGAVDSKAGWPHDCIDWERAASEVMYDYFESNGHYFRNI